MSELPSGLVAFLLLDVESSTQEWNASAPAMEDALAALDRDIGSIVAAHSGTVIKARGEGDSHFCVFSMASQSVEAAAAIQRRADQRLAVRAGVLVGEAHPRNGDYVGGIVNHAARIRSTAHGGQTVATAAVVDVAQDRLSPGLTFRTLGPHQVPDLPRPVELFHLYGPGLRRSFPPLRTQANRASAVMAIVIVDEVGSSQRLESTDHDLMVWQAALIRTLRELSDRHDGRYLKLVGDGCMVGFEDPRTAIEFARTAVADAAPMRAGIAVGLTDVVDGELTGRVVFDAYRLMRTAPEGEIRFCSLVRAMCGSDN
jgi:class 3 adenylate cyclase